MLPKARETDGLLEFKRSLAFGKLKLELQRAGRLIEVFDPSRLG
jgi:hypothetical protein